MIKQNNDEVICPKCCHQFRAIPVNIQNELATANERIRELEEKLELTNAQSKRNGLAYCAEREVSDKLEKALKVAKAFCDDLTADECPDTVAIPISTAIAEAAAIRSKGE